jgi:NAD(P)H dehydrogenase (quinone)
MARILVVYYSAYGHVAQMAQAVVMGARSVADSDVTLKRVPELVPAEVARPAGMKVDQSLPLATVHELADYDAIVFGTPTRFGNMAAQMRNFLDQTGLLWTQGALIGKVGSVFTSTATQHGGQETSIISFHHTLMHHGMILVGLPYSFTGLTRMDEITGSSPYGAATLAGPDGSRQPSTNELDAAAFQGKHVAQIAARLHRGGGEP